MSRIANSNIIVEQWSMTPDQQLVNGVLLNNEVTTSLKVNNINYIKGSSNNRYLYQLQYWNGSESRWGGSYLYIITDISVDDVRFGKNHIIQAFFSVDNTVNVNSLVVDTSTTGNIGILLGYTYFSKWDSNKRPEDSTTEHKLQILT